MLCCSKLSSQEPLMAEESSRDTRRPQLSQKQSTSKQGMSLKSGIFILKIHVKSSFNRKVIWGCIISSTFDTPARHSVFSPWLWMDTK